MHIGSGVNEVCDPQVASSLGWECGGGCNYTANAMPPYRLGQEFWEFVQGADHNSLAFSQMTMYDLYNVMDL